MDSSLRVLLLLDTNSGAFGGAEQNALALAHALADRGHHVFVAECGRPVLTKIPLRDSTVSLRFEHLQVSGIPAATTEDWRNLLSRVSPDCVVLSKSWIDCTSWRLDILLQLKGIRYLSWEHHPASPSGGARRVSWKLRTKREIHFRSVFRCACVSDAVRRALHGTMSSSPKATVLYPGVRFDVFRHSDAARVQVRRQFGVPENAVVVGTAGRLVYHKRNDLVLRAFADLRARRRDLDLWCLVAGTGAELGSLRQLATDLGIDDRARIVGWQDDIVSIWNAIDIFPFPSEDEGLGMVIVESTACGCLPLTGTAGGMPEVLGPDHHELLLDSRSPEVWSQRIERLAELTHDERNRIHRGVYASLRSRFDGEVQWARMVEWIEQQQ